MLLLLAPMEGLLDATLRHTLTRVGGIDRCVSEFIRVTGTLLPERAFLRIVPELRTGGRTRAGTPVRAQLMGSDPACLADNAARLAGLGPAGIDLNFGCPAKVVNRHGGGAALLQEPELMHRIVRAVRQAVPAAMPVSAKMRLGFEDDALAVDCARALAEGGAAELVVHARTKADGYRPPAYWERIPRIRAAVNVPVIANGEVWTLQDALRCRLVSGCEHLMLGRGMVADPGLALAIRAVVGGSGERAGCLDENHGDARLPWAQLLPLMQEFWQLVCARVAPRHRAGRLKQWLNYLRRVYPEAQAAYDDVRRVTDSRQLGERLFAHLPAAAAATDALPALDDEPEDADLDLLEPCDA